jgi:sulfate adenylyltransferase large subunit
MSRETVNIAIVGHVDHGKSTLIGRLLYETNSLAQGKMAEVRKIAKELGREAELAYIIDQLKEEREKNITIDTAQIFFKTRKRDFVIIDTPGHVEFIKNMLTGASLAQAGVLIVDVGEGVREQTRRHAFLLKLLGITSVVVVLNKMDLVNYDENRFKKVKSELYVFLETLGMEPDFFIPISAKEGENIAKKSAGLSWYRGPFFLKALDSLKVKSQGEDAPLRFPVQDVYTINGEEVIVGQVASGELKKGEEIILVPSGEKGRVGAIRLFERKAEKVEAGENIGLVLEGVDAVARGEILARAENPPVATDNFRGSIFWLAKEPLRVGEPITLRCATQEIPGVAKRIEKRINSSTLKVEAENAEELYSHETGVIVFEARQPMVVEKFLLIEELGRFVVERDNDLLGAGTVL